MQGTGDVPEANTGSTMSLPVSGSFKSSTRLPTGTVSLPRLLLRLDRSPSLASLRKLVNDVAIDNLLLNIDDRSVAVVVGSNGSRDGSNGSSGTASKGSSEMLGEGTEA